jgi:hypothetical protein
VLKTPPLKAYDKENTKEASDSSMNWYLPSQILICRGTISFLL